MIKVITTLGLEAWFKIFEQSIGKHCSQTLVLTKFFIIGTTFMIMAGLYGNLDDKVVLKNIHNTPKSYDYVLTPNSTQTINDVLALIQDRFNNNEKNNYTIGLLDGSYNDSVYFVLFAQNSLFSDLQVSVVGTGPSVKINGGNLIIAGSGELHFKFSNIDICGLPGYGRGIEALYDSQPGAMMFLTVEHCIIRNNIGTNYGQELCMDGAGIYAEGPAAIVDCEIYDNVGVPYWYENIDNNYENYSKGGGIAIKNDSDHNAVIQNCNIHNNIAIAGGGIYATGSGSVDILYNRIQSNTRNRYSYYQGGYLFEEQGGLGEGIYCTQCTNLTMLGNLVINQEVGTIDDQHCHLSCAVVIEYCGIDSDSTTVFIENNSFMNNAPCQGLWLINPLGNTLIRNNLSINNWDGFHLSDFDSNLITLIYNNAYSNWSEEYNVYQPTWVMPDNNGEFEPGINQQYEPIWNSNIICPLIDAGDPASKDSDGTPSDIGARRAVAHQFWEYEFTTQADREKWYWVSYPVLNSITNNALVASEFFKELLITYQDDNNVWHPTYLEEIDWMVQGNSQNIYWDEDEWSIFQNTHFVSSPQGYKVKLLERTPTTVILKETGFRTPSDTQFPIHGGEVENWLGYFRPDPAWPHEVFASIWDDINMIKTKDWCLIRAKTDGDYWGMSGKVHPLEIGDMVIVTTNEDHNFQWNNADATPPETKALPEYFVFDEKQDYVPVYLSIPDSLMTGLKEIGLYLEGVCKGAVVIEDNIEQISAYLDIDEKLTDGVVEFVFYYNDGKSQQQETKTVRMDSGRLCARYVNGNGRYPYFSINIISLDVNNVVPPELALGQNYPNPFNPSTTISYSLPTSGLVRLDIYNVRGQLVRTLIDAEQDSGYHSVVWNGTDKSGQNVASGIYFYRLSSPGEALGKRMLLMK